MRCPDCNKFVSLEFQDPEVDNLEISDDAVVTATVRLVRNCAECGTEMKEATLELEETHDITVEPFKDHINEKGETKHELEIEETGVDQIEEGGGRYAKSYFGATISYTVRCKCDEDKKDERWEYEGTFGDKVAASAMEEMV